MSVFEAEQNTPSVVFRPTGSPEGGGASNAYGIDIGAWINAVGGLFGEHLHPRGSGSMAARGIAAAQAKAAQLVYAHQQQQEKIANAYQSFAASYPGEPSVLIEQKPILADTKLASWAKKAADVAVQLHNVAQTSKQAKKYAKKIVRIEKKEAKRAAKLVGQNEYVAVAKYGLASGPPLTGSRDDPAGPLIIKHPWSE